MIIKMYQLLSMQLIGIFLRSVRIDSGRRSGTSKRMSQAAAAATISGRDWPDIMHMKFCQGGIIGSHFEKIRKKHVDVLQHEGSAIICEDLHVKED